MGNKYVVQRSLYARAVDGFTKLVLAKRYLARLLENKTTRRYVVQRHPDLMMEFEPIMATISLDQQRFSGALAEPWHAGRSNRVGRAAR